MNFKAALYCTTALAFFDHNASVAEADKWAQFVYDIKNGDTNDEKTYIGMDWGAGDSTSVVDARNGRYAILKRHTPARGRLGRGKKRRGRAR